VVRKGAMKIIKMTFDEAISICRKKMLTLPITKEDKEAWDRVSAACYTMKEIMPNFMKDIDDMLNRVAEKRQG
jgi:hypothetical protein